MQGREDAKTGSLKKDGSTVLKDEEKLG